ncbi:MAG: hypothetical protein PHT40_01635 [Patescibacteria group bacterium]|nr:hypothetical protein [Patescibacteria group bacterium]
MNFNPQQAIERGSKKTEEMLNKGVEKLSKSLKKAFGSKESGEQDKKQEETEK